MSAGIHHVESGASALLAGQPLALALRRGAEAAPIAIEPVRAADLSNLVSEAWRDACLRQGHPGTPLAEVPMRVLPPSGRRADSGPAGFVLEVLLPDGRRWQKEYSLRSLSHVASRAAEPLLASGALKLGQSYYYELVLDPPPAAPTPPEVLSPVCSVTVTRPPLSFLRVPLQPLLRQARSVDLTDDEVFPVFFTEPALAQAEACARRGAASHPPVETGAVLIGSLAACDVSNEFFVVVTEVLGVPEAEERSFSLSYSGESWRRIQTIVRARQSAHPNRAERLLGQCHGHNFLPHGGEACAACDRRATCDHTSVFVSREDQMWMGLVFAFQPWALCQIFGFSARKEPVSQLFSLSDGRWQPRGYYVLPELEAAPWSCPPNPEIERTHPDHA